MLHVLLPATHVDLAFSNQCALAMLHVVVVVANVLTTVSPHFFALAFHLALLEVSKVSLFLFCKVILAVAFKQACEESTLIVATISPGELALAFFLVVNKSALELAAIVEPGFNAGALLRVIYPLAGILIALLLEDAVAIRLVVQPVAGVGGAVYVHESALSTPLSINPVSFVNPAIFVLHYADAIEQFPELLRHFVLASVSPLVANEDV